MVMGKETKDTVNNSKYFFLLEFLICIGLAYNPKPNSLGTLSIKKHFNHLTNLLKKVREDSELFPTRHEERSN